MIVILTDVKYYLILVLIAFSWWLVILSIFSCACWPSICMSSLEKMSIHIFCWSFNSTAFLILICMNCSYILDSNPLLVISLVTIFPHTVGCLFILASFLCSAKPLRLDPLCLFLFLFPLSYEMDQNILLWFMSKSILPMLFPNNFMLFSLTFRPLSILSLLLYIVRKNVSVILLHVAGQFSQHHSLKRLLFLHCIFFFLSDCFD